MTRVLGGVGRTAVHVARKHAVHVLAGVRLKEKEEASKLKVDEVVAIDSDEELKHLHNLDAIADTVGGTRIQRLLKAIRKGGVLGSVLGQAEGADKYDIRVEAFMAQPDASRLFQLADDVARHEFSIPIARTMKLQKIQEVHRIWERRRTRRENRTGSVSHESPYCNFAFSALACFRMGMSGSASFNVESGLSAPRTRSGTLSLPIAIL